jgi:hypothetical protein
MRSSWFHPPCLAAGAVLFAVFLAALPGDPPCRRAALPVRKVPLYKHGMGYLERRGTPTRDRLVQLRADWMKDLLQLLRGRPRTILGALRHLPLRGGSRILIKVGVGGAQPVPAAARARIAARVSGEEFVGRVSA